jgi:pimeloyl-ACP methyl ester carboxylesterase
LFSILKVLSAVLICLILILLLLYFFQEKLIFYPQKISEKMLYHIRSSHKNLEDITLRMKDGTRLRGWFVKNIQNGRSKLIIYFGGKAEEVSWMIDEADRFKGWSAALMNYRGYGLSDGKPGEKSLFSDALEIFDYFSNRKDVDSTRIVIIGRSIGTGVAAYLARSRGVAGVILVSPYDSLSSVAQEIFPILPLRLILKHKFDSINIAPYIKAPSLVLIASDDKIIPPRHSKKLAEKWGGDVEIKEIKGVDHNTISDKEEYWESIGEFLKQF